MFTGKKIFDITPKISSESPVFPGDIAFSRHVAMDFSRGDHLGLSSMNTTLHIGAHADAPSHYHKDGVGIEARSLDYYLGDAVVLDMTHVQQGLIKPEHLKDRSFKPRVLFKTKSFPHSGPWANDFVALASETIEALAVNGVITIGIDTPSIDAADSKSLDSHQMIYKHDMAILEGIDLDNVSEGFYQLIALPLKIDSADASPVRAVLIS